MIMWDNLRMIHEYDEGYGERMDEELRAAYEAGCRKGYEKAMREQGMMGERRMPPYYPEYPAMGMREHYDPTMGMRGDYRGDYRGEYSEDMGERRRRRSNGQFM